VGGIGIEKRMGRVSVLPKKIGKRRKDVGLPARRNPRGGEGESSGSD